MTTTLERVQSVIALHFVDDEPADADKSLAESFEMDSLDSIELSMSLEDEFGIEMPDDDGERLHKLSPNDIVRLLVEKYGVKEGA